jgi:hypothetical protein
MTKAKAGKPTLVRRDGPTERRANEDVNRRLPGPAADFLQIIFLMDGRAYTHGVWVLPDGLEFRRDGHALLNSERTYAKHMDGVGP